MRMARIKSCLHKKKQSIEKLEHVKEQKKKTMQKYVQKHFTSFCHRTIPNIKGSTNQMEMLYIQISYISIVFCIYLNQFCIYMGLNRTLSINENSNTLNFK